MRYLFTAIIIWALAVPAALAQSGIGYVDVDRVFSQMPGARTIQSDIDAEFRAEMQSIEALEQEIRDLMQRKARDSATMSATDLRSLDNAIATKRADYQTSSNGVQARMQARVLEKRNAVRSRIISTTDQVRGERGLALIIDSDNVLSVAPEADLTDIVIQRLTAAMATRPMADNQVYYVVETMPTLAGQAATGADSIPDFLAKNLRYPQRALDRGIEGRVIVAVTVEKDGTQSDAKVIRGVHPDLDKEALRVARMMMFKPGFQRGEPVRVQMNIPVKFTLG
ncbi:MAG: TonB family protein [Pseudomonadota bacterium]